jgi:hypothetical protein
LSEASLQQQSVSLTEDACVNQDSRQPHSLVTITLSGPGLWFTIVGLIFCINLLSPSTSTTLVAIAPFLYALRSDYLEFLSLGPGGTPPTFAGYLKVSYLKFYALKDPFSPPPVLGAICPETGCFESNNAVIPKRAGDRPIVAGIAPQRQRNQVGPRDIYYAVRLTLESIAKAHPDLLRTDVSCFEKQGLALFATQPLNNTCRGEICHVHHTDQSFHMNLHPLDAKVVLEKGWGQRHPLAQGGWLSRYVPRQFMMIYSPRTWEELEVTARIVEAAAWWVAGRRFDLQLPTREEALAKMKSEDVPPKQA